MSADRMWKGAWGAALALACGGLAGGCGTETGNPDGGMVELGYNAVSSRPDQVGFDAAARVRVDDVWLRLEAVHLDLDCSSGRALDFDGIGLADHSGVEAAWQRLPTEEGGFCGVGTVALPDASNPDDAIGGAAIHISGALADGRPFVVQVSDAVDLAVALSSDATPEEGPWLMTFDMAAWLVPEELEALPDESLQLDQSTAVGSQIVDRLLDGLAVHVDAARDGQVDDTDRRIDVDRRIDAR